MAVGQTVWEPVDGGRILRSHVPLAALTRLLRETIDNDRHPGIPPSAVSSHSNAEGILAKFRPEQAPATAASSKGLRTTRASAASRRGYRTPRAWESSPDKMLEMLRKSAAFVPRY